MATNQSELDVGSDERQAGPAQPGSPAEVLMGLQLLRASTMASTRFQLALARQDRPQAMSALDLLIDVDAEIERLVSGLTVPEAANADLAGIGEWLAAQKSAIAEEKFNLACGIGGSGLVSPPDRLSAPAERHAGRGVDPALEEPGRSLDDARPKRRRATSTSRWWLVALVAIFTILAAVTAAGFAGGFDLPPEFTRLLR
jgi:hypothetical protein